VGARPHKADQTNLVTDGHYGRKPHCSEAGAEKEGILVEIAMQQTAVGDMSGIGQAAADLAWEHDSRVRELDRLWSSTWQELGQLAMTVRDNNEWKLITYRDEERLLDLPYTSFNSWLLNACPKSRSVVYAAIGALDELKDISPADLKQIRHSTAHVLKKLPRAMRAQPDVIADAKRMTTKEFVSKVKRERPDLHLEQFIPCEFRFTESQEKVIDKALAKAMEVYELPTRELAFEAICADWMLEE
jgi:hypothetical protein